MAAMLLVVSTDPCQDRCILRTNGHSRWQEALTVGINRKSSIYDAACDEEGRGGAGNE